MSEPARKAEISYTTEKRGEEKGKRKENKRELTENCSDHKTNKQKKVAV